MNDYSPEKLSEKWKGHTAGLLEILTKRWESGRAQKRFFSIGLPEPDASLDRVAPFKAKRILLYEGIVVMGHVALAFFPAYIPGKGAHYGSVVYSADPAPVDSLFELAWRVNELRKDNTSPPLGTEKVAAAIRDDRSQFARILLPPSIGGVTRAFFANICIHRSRLPLGYIHDRLVPLLIAPDKTDWCTILPLRFWDEEFKRIWSSGPAVYDQKEFKLRCQVLGIRP